jgi:hypothetical protein
MDGAGVLVCDKHPAAVAPVIHEIVTDRAVQDAIIASQDAALHRLEARDFGGTLLRFVEEVARSPRLPHPPTAFDFWDQVALGEELEEIRAYRPSAFQALPKTPRPPHNHDGHDVRVSK